MNNSREQALLVCLRAIGLVSYLFILQPGALLCVVLDVLVIEAVLVLSIFGLGWIGLGRRTKDSLAMAFKICSLLAVKGV